MMGLFETVGRTERFAKNNSKYLEGVTTTTEDAPTVDRGCPAKISLANNLYCDYRE